jgi:hypothetical protein
MTAIKRDGSELNIGDEVEVIGYHKNCNDQTFMVVVHLKGEPDRKLLGFKKKGFVFQDGLDSNYFKKV